MKRQLLPFLTEWLVKHGTDPVPNTEMDIKTQPMLYTAIRKKYLVYNDGTLNSIRLTVVLTKEGIQYLKEN